MIKPLGNKVLIESFKEEKKTESGIVLPDSVSEDRLLKGKVVAVGPGSLNDKGERVALTVKVGDAVLFKKGYSADEIEMGDKKYVLISEDEVLGLLS